MGWQAFVPGPEYFDPAHRIVQFIETGDEALLDGVFTDDAVLLESFSPYVFEGRAGVADWAAQMRQHVGDHVELHGELGESQELSTDAETTAFYSMPVTWRFAIGDERVVELGGMALLLRRDPQANPARAWRVERYAWAVVGLQRLPTGT